MGKVSKYWLAHPYQNYPLVTPTPTRNLRMLRIFDGTFSLWAAELSGALVHIVKFILCLQTGLWFFEELLMSQTICIMRGSMETT